MITKTIRYIIRWMPLVLFIMLFVIDREKITHKISYITFLLMYTSILIARVYYAKKTWHDDFNSEKFEKDNSIKKMSDYQKKLDNGNIPNEKV